MREHELIVYREFEDGDLLYDMAWLMEHYNDEYYKLCTELYFILEVLQYLLCTL